MATHSSVLAWRVPGTGWGVGGAGGLPSRGSHRVEHDWSDLAAAATAQNPSEEITCLIFSHRFLASPDTPISRSLTPSLPLRPQVRQVFQCSCSDWSAMISLLGNIRAFLLSAPPPPEPCLPSFPLPRAPHPLAKAKQPPLPGSLLLRHPSRLYV